MDPEEAIVNPGRFTGDRPLAPLAVLAATGADLRALRGRLGYEALQGRRLFISRLYCRPEPSAPVLAGPVVGAPYAVMVLEELIARGVRRVLFVGWCGALDDELAVGDLVLPGAALIDEGTSRHYAAGAAESRPSETLASALQGALGRRWQAAHRGAVWTTDAVFRETPRKVAAFRRRGAVAVDMETSALFTVAAFRGVPLAALLVVSDHLAGGRWQPGFRLPRFRSGRQRALQAVEDLCRMKFPRM